MRAREVIQKLEADGWYVLSGKRTGHKQFKHPTKSGKVTVPMHPGDIDPYTLKSIEKQSDVKLT